MPSYTPKILVHSANQIVGSKSTLIHESGNNQDRNSKQPLDCPGKTYMPKKLLLKRHSEILQCETK
jgi:hypothetical protein